MKKILFFVLFYSSSSLAGNIGYLNGLADTPGFSINQDGKVVSDWKADLANSNTYQKYSKWNGNDKRQVTISRNGKGMPTAIYYDLTGITSDRSVSFSDYSSDKEILTLFDDSGSANFLLVTEKDKVWMATPGYCNRVYKELGVKSSFELMKKLSECGKFTRFTPTEKEVSEAEGIVEAYSKHQKKSNDLTEKVSKLGPLKSLIKPNIDKMHETEASYADNLINTLRYCDAVAPKLDTKAVNVKASEVGRE